MLQVSVADHGLRVIAADGYAVKPMEVDVVHMMPGKCDKLSHIRIFLSYAGLTNIFHFHPAQVVSYIDMFYYGFSLRSATS